jgi:hypothetical protein
LAILTIINDAEAVTKHKKRLDLTPAKAAPMVRPSPPISPPSR